MHVKLKIFALQKNGCRMVLKNESATSGIRSLVSDCVPGAEQARLHGREISFVLPRDRVTLFPPLFNKVSGKFSTRQT
jgi:ATP-binding cassette subfamily A (ABC1) protein 5